ncbi:MAG: thiamine pyrophosphate-dependent enzyme, partial [Promethearchaeota archaeon]
MTAYKYSILNDAPHEEILLGNDAFVRGMIEAGVKVVAAYPGSPTSEMGVRLAQIQSESGIYFEFSTNEKVALELTGTASIGGLPTVTFMKSVGLNVAADSFVQLSKYTLPGGMVIILGDDPGPHSSQNEQDNRHYAKLGKIPMLEPSNVQEAKDFVVFAMEYSRKWRMPVVIRSTTRICHQTGLVKFGAKKVLEIDRKFDPDLGGGYIPLPGTLRPLREKSLTNLDKWSELANSGALLKEIIVGESDPKVGIITSGHAYAATKSALRLLGATAAILKLGVVYPLPMDPIVNFIQKYPTIKILEELDPVFEQSIKAELFDRHLTGLNIIGKEKQPDQMDLMISEYAPARLTRMLGPLFGIEPSSDILSSEIPLPNRPPQLCPGCGHRTSFHVATKVMNKLKGYSMADIGCYTLGYLPPYNQGKVLYSMGSGVPSASGMSKALTDTPIMSFLGDSTFFHAAMPGIVNTIFNKHK